MAKRKKEPLKIEERLAEANRQVKRLSTIIRSLKEMVRKGSPVEKELEAVQILLKSLREKYKDKLKEHEALAQQKDKEAG